MKKKIKFKGCEVRKSWNSIYILPAIQILTVDTQVMSGQAFTVSLLFLAYKIRFVWFIHNRYL